MSIDAGKYKEVLARLGEKVKLVAVSKLKPVEDCKALYDLGQRDFGENYVQELVDKQAQLPPDIRWHFIGHLQSNKVKYIAPFVHLIHGVDSGRLLQEIDKQAARANRRISCLLQVHIAREETKFGLDAAELADLMKMISSGTHPANADGSAPHSGAFPNVDVLGLMGMASFTEDPEKVRSEFQGLRSLFDQYFPSAVPSPASIVPSSAVASNIPSPPGASNSPSSPGASNIPSPPGAPILSMGMSADYTLAVEEGSNMVRIGSLLFGERG